MRGSGISLTLFFSRSVDPQLIPFWGIRDQHPFPPHTPYLIDSGQLIPDPPLTALSRDQCGDGKWGSYLPHTSHLGPPRKRVPRLPSATLIRTICPQPKTDERTEEGKMKT